MRWVEANVLKSAGSVNKSLKAESFLSHLSIFASLNPKFTAPV
jgi:hypothetical protein